MAFNQANEDGATKMPELPDVAVLKRYFDSTALHQTIRDISLTSEALRERSARATLKKYMIGHEFTETKQHGKYFFAGLDSGRWLLLHFGMTGDLKYFKDGDRTPDYTKLLVSFENGYHLAYVNVRKLGIIKITKSVEACVRERGLGPHVLSDEFRFAEFRQVLSGSRATVKSALMDQSRMAGIGNIYSDEILFQCGIHPNRRVSALDERSLRVLFDAMRAVLTTAIDHDADPATFPDDYIIPHRGPDGRCPKCGAALGHTEISGRSTYFCPECQPEPG